MKRTGFTLIELLVVISIIALLSSIVMTNLNSARAKGNYATILSQMKQIQLAALAYYNDNGVHAPDVNPGVAPALVPTYIKNWPTPPCGSAWSYDWDNWGTPFVGVHLYQSGVGAQYNMCVDTNNCSGAQGQNIQTVASKSISCP